MHLLVPFMPSVAVQNPQWNATLKPLFLSIPRCSCCSLLFLPCCEPVFFCAFGAQNKVQFASAKILGVCQL